MISFIIQCNQIYLVTPIAALLCKDPLVRKYDLSSVEYIFTGAAPMGKEIVDKLTEVLQPHFKQLRQGDGFSSLYLCNLLV